MHFRTKLFLQNLLALFKMIFRKHFQTPLDLWGGRTPCPRGRTLIGRGPGMHFIAKLFLQNLLEWFQIIFWKYFQTHPDIWGPPPCPRGRIPMRERCPGGAENSPYHYLYHYQHVLLKELCSKMHSWACPCGGPTLGAGWRPPDVQVGLEIFQITTCIISSKFW